MSIKKLGPDRFLVDITWTEGGRRSRLRRQVYGSQKDAREWEQKLKNSARLGELVRDNVSRERQTFSAFSSEWMDTYVKTNNKPGEQANKEMYLRVHLLPFFGKLYLDEVRLRDIERYKAAKVSEGLAAQTVNLHLGCLHRLFNCAMQWGLIDSNPSDKVAKLKDRKEKWQFLSFEEAERFMAAVPPQWQAPFLCALRTGMRQGELLALRWQDVDFTRRVICVENSLYDGQLCPTKSYGRREIRMVNELVEALLPLRNNGSAFVFPAQDCGPLHPKTLGRPLARAIKRSGVKRIRFHDLRHTAASHLVMAGVPIKTVQEILGHSDLAMTLRYAHLTPETREEAMVRLEEKVLNERRSRQSRSEVASEADANAAAGVSRT